MTHDVFISHSAKDKVIADAVCAALEAEKIRCWIAPRDIRSGEHWAEAINNAVKKTRVMVLIFSESSNQSIQVAKELTLAVNSESVVIPFKIDEILPSGVIEYYLADTHWLDAMNPPTRRHIQQLVEAVRHNLGEEVAIPFPSKNDGQSKVLSISPEEEIPSSYMISKKAVTIAAAVILCGLLLFGGISLFGTGGRDNLAVPNTEELAEELSKGAGEAAGQAETETEAQTSEPSLIAGSDAYYYIDYENGTIPIGDLPIGARVVDLSWEWEFRTGNYYSRNPGDEVKPVIWLVVAKDHYSGLGPHVTLLSEDLIGRQAFDNSTDRWNEQGSNHWGESGTTNAFRGLRPWLNSTGIHADEGFYRAFSDSFRKAVLTTELPNKEWQKSSDYSTNDNVFIPTTTELGGTELRYTYQIGSAYPYFQEAGAAKRSARLGGETRWYWTRSPDLNWGYRVPRVNPDGEFFELYSSAYLGEGGVRPALNLKSEILVSEIRN